MAKRVDAPHPIKSSRRPSGYAGCNLCVNGKHKLALIHRMVLEAFLLPSPGMMTDHINGDRMDNRLENLRYCTVAQNNANRAKTIGSFTSVYKGVYVNNEIAAKWVAQITKNRHAVVLGTFKTEEEAAMTYDRAAMLVHGEFARLNFPAKRNLKKTVEVSDSIG